jgi:hypothetical protein
LINPVELVRKEDRRCAGEEDLAMAAHEVDGGGSHQDEDIEAPAGVLPTQKLEVRAFVFRLREPRHIEILSVVLHTLRQAVGEQLWQLPRRDDGEPLVESRRVEDQYLLRTLGFLRAHVRSEDGCENGCQPGPPANIASQGRHVRQVRVPFQR